MVQHDDSCSCDVCLTFDTGLLVVDKKAKVIDFIGLSGRPFF